MKIGFYFKSDSQIARDLFVRIAGILRSRGHEIYVEKSLVSGLDLRDLKVFDARESDLDLIIVIGGDGTVIKILHELGEKSTPIMTVRMGRRGILLDVAPIEIESRIEDLLNGRYTVRNYERIYAKTPSRVSSPAINEILITPSSEYLRSRVLRFSVYRDDVLIYSLEGDGIIISTPIGSTAYSLSAGGPIVDHSLPVMILTPLLSINLWARPVILPISSIVRVFIRRDSVPAEVIVDGIERISVSPGEWVEVTRYPHPARIIRFHRDEEIYERIFERR
ncbi:MAG: NAD(+)/NADH kinase [Sulfolobales archaeon]